MPGGNGTGPLGYGSMTGRGAGYCAGYSVPGYANPVSGRGSRAGLGRGWSGYGRGRGWRNWYYATGMPGWQRAADGVPTGYAPHSYPSAPTAEAEKDMLKGEAEALKRELADIQERISTLERSENFEERS